MKTIKYLLPDITLCIKIYEGTKNTNEKACAVNRLVQTLFQMSYPNGVDEELRANFFADWLNANEQDYEAEVIELAADGELVKKGSLGIWETIYEG